MARTVMPWPSSPGQRRSRGSELLEHDWVDGVGCQAFFVVLDAGPGCQRPVKVVVLVTESGEAAPYFVGEFAGERQQRRGIRLREIEVVQVEQPGELGRGLR